MIALLLILVALALFGVGGVVKGVLWLTLLAVAAFLLVGVFGFRSLSRRA